MNTNKRYCQNRVRKRKRNVGNDVVLDEKENDSAEANNMVTSVRSFSKTKMAETKSKGQPTYCKAKKPAIPTNISFGKMGLFKNVVQTKLFNRGDYGKEMKARLDQSVREIISTANKGNECKCLRQCKPGMDASPAPEPNTLPARLSPDAALHHIPNIPETQIEKFDDRTNTSLEELDRRLYPEFTRVTNSCIETLSQVYDKKKYGTTIKKALVDIYLQGRRESTQELSCTSVSDAPKSRRSVATSPLTFHSPLTGDSAHTFKSINFVGKYVSMKQHLKETIGPGSSCKSPSPEAQQNYFPHTSHPTKPYCSPSVRRRQTESFPKCSSDISPIDFSSTVFDGGGDRLPFRHRNLNHLLPPIDEEDSPEFQYYPRKMF